MVINLKKRIKIRINVAFLIIALFLGLLITEKKDIELPINQSVIKKQLMSNMNLLKAADLYTGVLTKFVDISTVSDDYYEISQLSVSKHSNGVYIVTNDEVVLSLEDGLVTFIGRYENIAKCVIIKTYDGREIIYGDLDNIEVGLYQYIKKNTIVGSVKSYNANYRYYLAMKEKEYIDVELLLE